MLARAELQLAYLVCAQIPLDLPAAASCAYRVAYELFHER
jgi:hypothetical protein